MRGVGILLCVLFLGGAGISACSLPRIILLSDPLTAEEHNDLGVSYEAAGEWDRALAAYTQAATKNRGWDQPLINQGNVHAAMGNWGEAAASYRRALRRNPENLEAMNNLAYVLLQLRDPRQAMKWSQRARTGAPENVAFISTQARILAELGRDGDARDLLAKTLLRLSPDDPHRQAVQKLSKEISGEL
ncbi:tetratricopeptide repeat protein [Desulfonatronum thioautotrophicum]|uniref:tetratricopeptide repeat protein n=1 Tax=Desulfonatronum thioautotrophicum TaxID=617001 RepID=UPI00069AECB7|nr:tetratricopeptide repeat protein [Desulfonatronum thioautotrophicum]